MRTNIVIDEKLIKEAVKMSGLKTKKKTVEEGLHLLVKLHKQGQIKKFRGKLKWTGNLSKMRTN